MATIDDQIQMIIQTFLDFPAFGQRQIVAGEHQCRSQQWFAEHFEQRQRHRMIGDAQTDGLAFRMQHPARQLLGAFEDEGVTARRCRLQQAVLGVIDPGKLGDFGEVTTHQRQVMAIVHITDVPDSLDSLLVAELTAQRIAGIGRDRRHAARPQDFGNLGQKARLRCLRMN